MKNKIMIFHKIKLDERFCDNKTFPFNHYDNYRRPLELCRHVLVLLKVSSD